MYRVDIERGPVYIRDDQDFRDLLASEISDSARDWFDNRLEEAEELSPEIAVKNCPGECDRLYALQERYENTLQDAEELTRELYSKVMARNMSKQNAEVLQGLAAIIKALRR